jgi:transketolase
MTVIVPSDAVETDRVIRWAADTYGPMYIRLVRPNCPVIHDENYKLEPGKIRIEREGKDITLVATGETVYHALLAAERLEKDHGIHAEVLNVVFIKPFDTQTLLKSAQKTGKVITVESHQIMGGLAGVVCEELSSHAPTPVRRLGTQDRFGQSGTGEALFKEYGIDWEAIYQEAINWLKASTK